MSLIGFEIRGDREAAAGLRGESAKVHAAMRRGVALAAHHLQSRIQTKLSLTSHAPGTPTPSPPGHPPSLITGSLRRSVKVRGPRSTGDGWEAHVGPTIVYGRIQEFGGRTGRGHRTHLPARPYVGPATRESALTIRAIIRREVARAR